MTKTKEDVITPEELFLTEHRKALEEYRISREAFNNAEGDYIDIAIDFLRAAELKLSALCKKAKLLHFDLNGMECYALLKE